MYAGQFALAVLSLPLKLRSNYPTNSCYLFPFRLVTPLFFAINLNRLWILSKKLGDRPCTICSASIPFAIETWGRTLRGSTSGGLRTPAEKCRPPGFGNEAGDKKQGTSLTNDIQTRRAANRHSESTRQQTSSTRAPLSFNNSTHGACTLTEHSVRWNL
jgi:hypothetical protein